MQRFDVKMSRERVVLVVQCCPSCLMGTAVTPDIVEDCVSCLFLSSKNGGEIKMKSCFLLFDKKWMPT